MIFVLLSILDLQGNERDFARIMLVNHMQTSDIGLITPCPIRLLGTGEEAAALLDLLYDKIPKGRLCVIANLQNGIFNMQVKKQLFLQLQSGNGFIPPQLHGEIAVVLFEWDSQKQKVACSFGYSMKGIQIFRNNFTGEVQTSISLSSDHIISQSLYMLYQLTGNINFIHILGIKQLMLAKGDSSTTLTNVDPLQYYSALGLNPYVSRFMSNEILESIIKAIKRGIAKQLHEDVIHHTSTFQETYLRSVLEAAAFLEDEQKRKAYTNWL